ncbi:hypothetical protein EAL2_808p07630 (plasmid) [Peptoclostridium acidaminophilum DSM 3953]|uniref:Uncharacterized protein n=1 Tax=Peptoclostridium acidaminophilum DSM 3953 TaxID=1286171 RepID=W8UC20_PEPAC|nr:hypothetical protein EAL2_808p07630 [Peptoclostridium acidaminophilum DSM 3953]
MDIKLDTNETLKEATKSVFNVSKKKGYAGYSVGYLANT